MLLNCVKTDCFEKGVGKERNAIDISVFGYKDAIPNCILVLDVSITTSKSLLSVVKNL